MSSEIEDTAATRKFLFVASTGGHLAQLVRLSARLNAAPDSMWVTFDNAQSRSLLADRRVTYVPYIGQRDWRNALRARRDIDLVIRGEEFDHAVSTGAAIAVSALPLAASAGIPTTYVESIARVEGPSLSGKILSLVPGIQLRTQHRGWSGRRWKFIDGILSTYRTSRGEPIPHPSLFVTLGTLERYRFDSLVDAVLATGLADDRTVWQLGATSRVELPGRIHTVMDAALFRQSIKNADVTIAHSGVGTLLQVLEAGRFPVLAVRRRSRLEHVDDHQAQIAALASRYGIARAVETDSLSRTDILEATGWSVIDS